MDNLIFLEKGFDDVTEGVGLQVPVLMYTGFILIQVRREVNHLISTVRSPRGSNKQRRVLLFKHVNENVSRNQAEFLVGKE